MFIKLAAATIVLIGACSGSSAFPITTSASKSGIEAISPLVQVAQRDHKRHWKGRHHWRHDRHRGHWRGGNWRRHGPPPGWRRHHSRPWNWRQRNCVMLGPVWFCP